MMQYAHTMTIDSAHFKRLLEAKRDELLTLMQSSKESVRPVELDQASVGRLSRMDAMQVQAMALAAEGRRRDELQRIEAAFERIQNDEYGHCISCGEEIATKRLELDPTILTCIRCASGRSE